MAWVRLTSRFVALLALAAFAACSATESQQRSPTAPTAATGASTAQAADEGAPASAPTGELDPALRPQSMGGLPPTPSDVGAADVSFPPRNEPLLFRQALEVKYRDDLHRSTVQTYVDQEGTVVWTQEYLRYRVNLCSHQEAVDRVFRQIDGFGIAPVCGSTSSVAFPPRDQPYDFMLQLENKYRTSLGRQPGPTYVDVEGNIVWTQEYLRYRVSGCAHTDAQQRVFAQIDGRGVQPDCSSGGGGSSNVINGFVDGEGYVIYELGFTGPGGGSARFTATLRWADASIDLDLYLTTTACSTYPPSSSCLLAASDRVGVNSETVSYTVRPGDRYYLWVDNFDTRGTNFTIEGALSAADGAIRPTLSRVPHVVGPSVARKTKR